MRLFFIFILSLVVTDTVMAQQRQIADQIVAVVNDHVILKSDVDQQLAEFMQQSQIQSFDEQLWYHVLESIIDNYVLIEKARIDSIIVSDAEVDRVLNQRINQLMQQVGSEQELERVFGQSLVEIKAEYADHFRNDMLVNRVRQQKIERINITRPEVREFFESIPVDSLPIIPESVSLSQITAIPPPKPDARDNARRLAGQLRDSIMHHSASLEDLARRYSDAPSASQGGELPPLLPTDQFLPEFAAAASALGPGELSEVVDTPQGFHIIRLNERRGNNISTHHILISIPEEELDEQYAIDKLTAIRDSVLNHNKTFAQMARRHSDDRNTAPSGGLLTDPQSGQRHIPINELEPSLHRIVLLLDNVGDISTPRSYQYGSDNRTAYRIVRLNDRIEEHRANLEQDYQLIRHFALQHKSQMVLTKWLRNLREEMYVEYRIFVPEFDPLDMPDQITPGIPEEPVRQEINP